MKVELDAWREVVREPWGLSLKCGVWLTRPRRDLPRTPLERPTRDLGAGDSAREAAGRPEVSEREAGTPCFSGFPAEAGFEPEELPVVLEARLAAESSGFWGFKFGRFTVSLSQSEPKRELSDTRSPSQSPSWVATLNQFNQSAIHIIAGQGICVIGSSPKKLSKVAAQDAVAIATRLRRAGLPRSRGLRTAPNRRERRWIPPQSQP